jgi:hypothetical protein
MNALDGGALLYLCRPYIRLKREQVEVALRFQDRKFQYLRFGKSDEHHRQEQEDYKRMRELKGTASRGRRRQTA